MRRAILPTVFVLALAACDDSPTGPVLGHLRQPDATAIAADRLFVSSPSSDALKVMDLQGDGGFLRAPNPLAALEVPALRRPGVVHAISDGVDERRELIVVLSSLDPQVRLLDAEAMTPLGLPMRLPGRPVAVDHVPGGNAIHVLVAWPEALDEPAALVTLELEDAVFTPGGALEATSSPLVSMDVIPLDLTPGGLAVSDVDGSPLAWVSDVRAPRLLLIDVAAAAVEEIDAGVALATLHASPEAGALEQPIPKGRFVYGLAADGEGIVAFDLERRDVAEALIVEEELRPVRLPERVVALTPALRVLVDRTVDEETEALQVPFLLLAVTMSGDVYYLDGVRMAPLDGRGRLQPEPGFTLEPPHDAARADGGSPMITTVENPDYVEGGDAPARVPAVDVTPGVTMTRTWRVAWRGEVRGHAPALGDVDFDGDRVLVRPLSAPVSEGPAVIPGDRLTVTRWYAAEAPSGCDEFGGAEQLLWEVVEVDEEDGAMALGLLDDGAPLPRAECFAERVVYRVRAGGFTVSATGLDELWRLEPGDTFEYEGERFMRTEPMVDGPEIRFTLAEEQNTDELADGAERRIAVQEGFDYVVARPDVSALQLSTPSMPGGPAVHRADTTRYGGGRLIVPFAGSGYLVSFDLRTQGHQRVHR